MNSAIDTTYLGPLVVEFIVFLIFFTVLLHFILLWSRRKNKITQMLILYLGFYFIAIGFTLFTQINKRLLINPFISVTIIEHIDEAYRFFVFIANYYFYRFYLEIFADSTQKSKINNIFLILTIFGVCLSVVSLFIDLDRYFIVDITLIIQSFCLYIPMAKQSLASYRQIPKEDFNRYRFLFLYFMAVIFTLVWIANIANVAWDLFTDHIYGTFWLISWLLIAVDVCLAFLGFGMPSWFKNFLEKYTHTS